MKFLQAVKFLFSLWFRKLPKPEDITSTFETKEVEFVFLFVDGNNAEEVNGIVSAIIDKAIEHDAVFEGISSNFLAFLFNVPMPIENPNEKRLAFIESLNTEERSKLSLVHGSSLAQVGNFGSKYRMNYNALIPHYNEIMKELISLNYGEIKRLDV